VKSTFAMVEIVTMLVHVTIQELITYTYHVSTQPVN
jgi:hypothetical protein